MEVIEHLLTAKSLVSLISLTLLEIVLGIDNIVFISIIANKLDPDQRKRATNIGLIIAVIPRVALLFLISWIVQLNKALFTWDLPLAGIFAPSGRDLILMAGGLFLIYKSTTEIHEKLQGPEEAVKASSSRSFFSVILQITLLNVVFSFDSILTAIGLVDAEKSENLWIMILAVVFSMIIMILFANRVNTFVSKNPTIKMLALAFLVMIGTILLMESLHKEIPKGYVYFAMAFALGVELLNLRMRKKAESVKLKMRYVNAEEEDAKASNNNLKDAQRTTSNYKE